MYLCYVGTANQLLNIGIILLLSFFFNNEVCWGSYFPSSLMESLKMASCGYLAPCSIQRRTNVTLKRQKEKSVPLCASRQIKGFGKWCNSVLQNLSRTRFFKSDWKPSQSRRCWCRYFWCLMVMLMGVCVCVCVCVCVWVGACVRACVRARA